MNDSLSFNVNLNNFSGPLELLLDLAKSQKVDLEKISITILVDQFLEFIRKKGVKVPVVVVSAHVDKDVAAQLGKMGISGIVSKPFEVERVIDVMNRTLGRDEIHGGSR